MDYSQIYKNLENNLIIRRYSFVREVSEIYSSENRSDIGYYPINNENEVRCRYLPAHDNTEGCAIGRHLPPEIALKCDLIGAYGEITLDPIFKEFPEYLVSLGYLFLRQVQALHDMSDYWCSTGLTRDGKVRYLEIVRNISEYPDEIYAPEVKC